MDFFSAHQSQIEKYLTKSQYLTLQLLIKLFSHYEMVILGDREFQGIELSYWLKQKNKKAQNSIYFAFREKNNIYLKRSEKKPEILKDLKLIPGVKVLHKNVQLTKQKGFGRFNLLAYKKRNYRHHKVKDSWFIITNLDSPDEVIKLYKKRAGIEAMFRDCSDWGV
ncbi:MAG: transposase [Waterburya sp.]